MLVDVINPLDFPEAKQLLRYVPAMVSQMPENACAHSVFPTRIISMVPIAIEELRPDMRDELETFIQNNPSSYMARLKPRLVSENGIHWWLQHGSDLENGVAGFGSSIDEAIANFEKLCLALEEQAPGRLMMAQ